MSTVYSDKKEEKKELYAFLYTQLQGLLDPNLDAIANMANFCAAIQQNFQFHWVGFYRVIGEELILGPFQGPPACVRIARGSGVCGTAWQRRQTMVVDDVHQFPGHIACSPFSRSEIVVPVFGDENSPIATPNKEENNVVAVLDIDADVLSAFDDCDKLYLEKCTALLTSAGQ